MKIQEKFREIEESIGCHVNGAWFVSPGYISIYTVIIWVMGRSRDYENLKNKICQNLKIENFFSNGAEMKCQIELPNNWFELFEEFPNGSKWANTINIWQIIIKLILKFKR